MPISRFLGHLGSVAIACAMIGLSPATTAQAAPPPTIGLFTDYGWDDPYVSQIKGVIVTINPNARILDLIHNVAPFNITEGSFLLDQCAEEFPPGTIFVAVVDPGVGTERDPVLIQTGKGKFFIGPDNGLFTRIIAHEGLARGWVLDKPDLFRTGDVSRTFHGRDIFGPIAAQLAAGGDPDKLGSPTKTLQMLPDPDATFTNNLIYSQAVHIDRFGNIILNLQNGTDIAAKLKEGTLVKISVGKESFSAPLVKTYGEVEKGRLVLLYGGSGFLEIVMNQGSAVKQLKVEPGTPIFLKP
jgi:S-adenosyl-L-methionine hydrolase (adenosine-forming)